MLSVHVPFQALLSLHSTEDKLWASLFCSKYFKISLEISSLTHVLFRSALFNLHVIREFSSYLSVISSCLILLCSKTRHSMISILLNLWWWFLWPTVWFILVTLQARKECIFCYACVIFMLVICKLKCVKNWRKCEDIFTLEILCWI